MQQKLIRIICFGDSITYGESGTKEGGWCAKLQRDYLQAIPGSRGPSILVYNLGLAGDTSDGLKNRFESELKNRTIKTQINIVILSFGINDLVMHKNKNRVPIKYFASNLRTCLEIAKNQNTTVVLTSILPFDKTQDGKVNIYQQVRRFSDIQKYNHCLREIAQQNSSLYLDIYSEFMKDNPVKLLGTDGLHPNDEGHDVIYRKIKNSLKKYC